MKKAIRVKVCQDVRFGWFVSIYDGKTRLVHTLMVDRNEAKRVAKEFNSK